MTPQSTTAHPSPGPQASDREPPRRRAPVAAALAPALSPVPAEPEEDALPVGASGERRHARMVALQALYELDATHHDPAVVIARRIEADQTPAAAAAYARQLVEGVRVNQGEIDAWIVEAAPAWPLEQMSLVDKGVLRLALYELLHQEDVPPKVAINEAVELAKVFGHETSPKFVNGVLGTIERVRRHRA